MILALASFVFVIAIVMANLEIQIEGEDGWATKLPTWRITNAATTYLLGGAYHPLTGYHFYLQTFVLLFFHFPFVVGYPWSLSFELLILSFFFFFWMIEDFFWFAFNPRYGLRRFKKGEIPWHQRWVWGMPVSYYKFFSLGAFLGVLSYIIWVWGG